MRRPRAAELISDSGAPSSDGFIYFMTSAVVLDDGHIALAVKIGHSALLDSINVRVSNIQLGNPNVVRLVAVVAGSREEEDALHARLEDAGAWLRGEWFRLDLVRAEVPHILP